MLLVWDEEQNTKSPPQVAELNTLYHSTDAPLSNTEERHRTYVNVPTKDHLACSG